MDEFADAEVPVGICSLNCEDACRLALDAHHVPNATDVIVGRDSVEERKPHPQPLLTAVRELGVAPE